MEVAPDKAIGVKLGMLSSIAICRKRINSKYSMYMIKCLRFFSRDHKKIILKQIIEGFW